MRWTLRTPGQYHPVMVGQGKGRGHMHIPLPGMEMGQLTKNLGWKEKWMDSSSLATSKASQKLQKDEDMIALSKPVIRSWFRT